jgi:hypothetical protein
VLTDAVRSSLLALAKSACELVPPSLFSATRSRSGIAYYDSSRDKPITEVADFPAAVTALQSDPLIARIYGPANAHRLAIQFVYNTCGLLDNGMDIPASFDATWSALGAESSQTDWRFVAVANVSNFSFGADIADLGHGVSIQGRSYDRLRQALGLDEADLNFLAEDWREGGSPSSYVLVVETRQPKQPANFICTSDGAGYQGQRAFWVIWVDWRMA